MSLSVSDLVRVTINLSPLSAAVRSFGTLMIAGDSAVINAAERFRTYTGIDGVAADFGLSAPEYHAAALYFGQTPKPGTLMCGRWVRAAIAAENIGGILSASEQSISNWNNISNGSLTVTINGSAQTLTGLNFTAETNLNGVASIVTAALSGGATCVFDGSEFVIKSGTTGAGVKASGLITLTGTGTNADTITVNGVVITLVSGTPTGSQIKVGGTAAITAANLQYFLTNSTNVLLTPASYTLDGTEITVEYDTVGIAGNSFTLAKSSTGITISGAVLSGGAVASSVGYATNGTGVGVAVQLKLDSANSQSLVAGYDAESPAECAAILADASAAWYGLMFQASVQPTDDQNIAVATFIEALDLTRIFGVTIVSTDVLSALITNDLASRLKDGAFKQSFCQYSQNAYAIASFFGRGFTVNFAANNTTITLMFKQEPGVTGEDLTENQAVVLASKRCNVFVDYVNDTVIIQHGVMSGPAYFDEIHGTDWLQNAIQVACFNVLYTSTTKVPQTDAGVNQLVNAIDQVCGQAVFNGLVAPGTWNAGGFGQLTQGDYLKAGYYIYAQPIALQSQSDRETRQAPPIQVAIKLAGAIQGLDVQVDVNR